MTSNIDQILERVDNVLHQNRRIEWTYIGLTVLLFSTGIACFVAALISGEFLWSTPSAVTTALLYWPLNQIKDIRKENIALATAPMLINQLPTDQAAVEMQKLLQTLYGGFK